VLSPFMFCQDTFRRIGLLTALHLTLVGFVAGVDPQMGLQNTFLVERLGAVGHWALVDLFRSLKLVRYRSENIRVF